jgi:hypothetical protein
VDIMVLEIDGSLDHPIGAAAVAIWAPVLSGVAITAALSSGR